MRRLGNVGADRSVSITVAPVYTIQPSIAEIGRATALARTRITITSTSAASEGLAWQGGFVTRGSATRIGELVHVGAALTQRASRVRRHEEEQQWQKGKSTDSDGNRSGPCRSARAAMLRNHQKPMSLGV